MSGRRVGVLQSYLGVGERRRNWELASRGALDVVVVTNQAEAKVSVASFASAIH